MAEEIQFEPETTPVDFQPFSPVLASVFADPHDLAVYHAARASGLSDRQAIAGGYGDNGVSYYGDNTTNPQDPIVALPPDTPGYRHNRLVELTGPDGRTGIARLSEHMPLTKNLKGDASIDLNPAAAAQIGHPGGVYPVSWRFIEDPGPAALKAKIDFSPETSSAAASQIDFTPEEPPATAGATLPPGMAWPNLVALRSGKSDLSDPAVDGAVAAGLHGFARNYPGVALGAEAGAAVGAASGPAGIVTGPLAFLGTMLLTNKAIEKGEKFLAPHSDALQELQKASEDHPLADTAGSLFALGPQAVKSLRGYYDLIRNAPTAGRAAARVAGAAAGGATAGTVIEETRPYVEKMFNLAGEQLGIPPDKIQDPTVRSVIETAAIGALLNGRDMPTRVIARPWTGAEVVEPARLPAPAVDVEFQPIATGPGLEPAPAAPQTALGMIEQRMGGTEPGPPTVEPHPPDPAPLTPSPPAVEPIPPPEVAFPVPAALAPATAAAAAAPQPPGNETLPAEPGIVGNVPMSQVAVRPELMQFKQSDNQASGTNKHDRIDTPYDPLKAGVTLLWEPANPAEYDLAAGERYIVVNGHHRDELRRRQNVPTFNAQIVREADGVSVLDARRIGAEINIADGKGTIFDQANWIRDTAAMAGPDVALARARAIGNRGRKASNIALAAADDLYTAFINERVSPDHAEAIALAAPRQPGLQRAGLNQALKGASPQDSANLVQALKAKAAAGPAPKQGGFPWDDDEEIKRAELIGARASAVQKEISEQLASVQGAARRPEKARELGVNVSDPAAVQARIVQLHNLREIWRKFGSSQELIGQLQGKQTPAEIIQHGLAAAGSELLSTEQLPHYAQGALQAVSRATYQGEPAIMQSKWRKETVSIESLRPGNEMLYTAGSSFIPRASMNQGPIVVNAKGEILDGNNRVFEALKRGEKTIEIYREVKPTTVPPDDAAGLLLQETPTERKRYRQLSALRDSRTITGPQSAELEQLERAMGQSFLPIETDPQAMQAATAARQRELDQLEIRRRQQQRLVGGDIETQTGIFGPETDKGGNLMLFEGGPPRKRLYPAYSLAELKQAVAAGRGTAAMEEEIAAREAGTSTVTRTPQIIGKPPPPRPQDPQLRLLEGPGSQVDTPEFRRWFGNSKVVDAQGRPLVVYHGTTDAGFKVFDPQRSGSATGRPLPGFYFTDHPMGAASYSGTRQSANFAQPGTRGNYAVFLSLKNPLVVDAKGRDWTDIELGGEVYNMDELANLAKDQDHDGLIVNNIFDEGRFGQGYGWGERVFVAFRPNQIKSATANRGTFSSRSPSILAETSRLPNKSRRARKGADDRLQLQLDLFTGTAGLGTQPLQTLGGGYGPAQPAGAGAHPAGPAPVSGQGTAAAIQLRALAFQRSLILNPKNLDLVGQVVKTPYDLARVLQPYRDPRLETFRWILVDRSTKQILRVKAVSSRLPGSTAMFPHELTANSYKDRLKELLAECVALNADVAMNHNHPSGRPRVSRTDRDTTRAAELILGDRLLGHVVINHGSYYWLPNSHSAPQGSLLASPHARPEGEYALKPGHWDPKLLTPEVPHPVLGTVVDDLTTMVAVAMALQVPDNFVSLVFTDSQYGVRAVFDVDQGFLQKPGPEVVAQLQDMARQVGGRHALLYYNKGTLDHPTQTKVLGLILRGAFWDAVIAGPPAHGYTAAARRLSGIDKEPEWERWMGDAMSVLERQTVTLEEGPPAPLGSTIQVGSKRNGYREVELRQLDKIPIADLPALVELTRQLGLDVPRIQRLAKARGYFRHGPNGEEIALDFRIFADPVIAAKVLAHEIGHLKDFLPDGTLKRGNLLGRLATLQNYLTSTLPIDPKSGAQVITKADRGRLRLEAQRTIGPRPKKTASEAEKKTWSEAVSKTYLQLINDELKRRGLALDATTGKGLINNVREELIALSDWWKPFLDDAAAGKLPDHYIAYRSSGVELYADMISVLLNSPADVKERAPVTFETLFNYLDRKPAVRDAFFEAWDLLGPDGERRLSQRRQKIRSMFKDGEEIFNRAIEARQKTATWREWLNAFRTAQDTRYWPAIRRERFAAKGGNLEAARRPLEWLFDAHPLADNEVYVWMHRVNEAVRKPLLQAGLTEADLGEYLYFDRVANESYPLSEELAKRMENDNGGRAHLANPAGHTPATATEQLAFLEAKLGSADYRKLQTAAQIYRDLYFEVAERMRAEGMIGDEAWSIVVANRDHYATFLALTYADLHVPAGIKQQIGYLGDIANPYTAQTLKAITALRAIEFNKAKRITAAHLQQYFPGDVTIAPGKWNGRRSVPQAPRDPDLALVTFMAGGKQVGVHVARELHDMLEYNESSAVEVLSKILNPLHWMWQQVFYPTYITFSPLFQIFRNPYRDIKRTMINLPNEANMLQAITTRWGETRTMVKAWVKEGKITPDILEALDARALPPPMGTWQRQMAGEDMFIAIASRFGLARPGAVKEGHWVERIPVAGKLFRALSATGQIRELVPKVGAYRLLTKDLGFSPEDAAGYVRSYIGTPNWIKKGTWTHLGNEIFPFLNVWSKGWQADARMMRGRTAGPSGRKAKTAGSWWIRWLLTGATPKILMAAAAAGIFGETLRRLYGRVGGYWMQNYDVIPLGERPGGKIDGNLTVFVPLPKDATDRVLGGFTYLLARAAFDWAKGNRQVVAPGQGPALGTSDMPSINPAIKITNGWGTYLAGGNPYDSFRNQHVLTDQEQQAGWKFTLGSMLAWTWNQQGASTFVQYNPNLQTPLETVISAIPGINGMIKWTDTGLREAAGREEQAQKGERAQIALRMPDQVQQLRTEYNWLKGVGEVQRTPTMQARYKVLAAWNKNVYEPFVEASKYDNQDHGAAVQELSRPYLQLGR